MPLWRLFYNLTRTDGGLDLGMEIKALHMCVALLAPWVPGVTWHWFLPCVRDVTLFVVATAVKKT